MLEVSVKSMNVNEAKKISIDLNGMDSSMTGNLPVQTATEGKVYHQAYELTRDCTVPKEMERTGVYTKKENGITAGNEKHKEKPQTCMDYLVCGDDLEVLVQETDLLDEYTSTQFDRAISRIKKQRAQTQESVDRRVQRDRKQKDEFQRKHTWSICLRRSFRQRSRMLSVLMLQCKKVVRFIVFLWVVQKKLFVQEIKLHLKY